MFLFSLESLLKLRVIEKTKQQLCLAKKIGHLNQEREEVNKYYKEITRFSNQTSTNLDTGAFSLNYYNFLNNYLRTLSGKQEISKSRIEILSKEVEHERNLLKKSELAVKSLQKLKESRYQEYLYHESRKEQELLDDQYAQQIFLKKGRRNEQEIFL